MEKMETVLPGVLAETENRGGGSGIRHWEGDTPLGLFHAVHWSLSGGDFTEIEISGLYPRIILDGHISLDGGLVRLYFEKLLELGGGAMLIAFVEQVERIAFKAGKEQAQNSVGGLRCCPSFAGFVVMLISKKMNADILSVYTASIGSWNCTSIRRRKKSVAESFTERHKMIQKHEALRYLKSRLDAAEATLNHFAERFAGNPAYAFEWGQEAVTAAANKRVCSRIFEALSAPEEIATVETIVNWLRDTVLYTARFPQRSTSYLSNEMEREVLAAQAALLKDFS